MNARGQCMVATSSSASVMTERNMQAETTGQEARTITLAHEVKHD